MATASEFVAVAMSQVGYTEGPPESNRTKYGEWFGMDGQPWCDMFVSWCAAQVGALAQVGKYAYCPYHVDYFKVLGKWHPAGEAGFEPQPGDVVFFSRLNVACHVGIVRGMTAAGNAVLTIEGNTSVSDDDNGGAVMTRTRGWGNPQGSWGILGFGRPDFDEEGGEGMTPEDAKMLSAYVWGYEVDGTSAANRLKALPRDAALETLGYKNRRMNGENDVYQLITDIRHQVLELQEVLALLESKIL